MGATRHFLWIVLGSKTGADYKYVPFQGGTAGRITGLLNGTIDLGGVYLLWRRHRTGWAVAGHEDDALAVAADAAEETAAGKLTE